MHSVDIVAQSLAISGLDLLQTIALFLTAGGLGLTTLQIRRESRSARELRVADLSWLMYQNYAEPTIRAARGNVEGLAHSPRCPQTAAEYKSTVADSAPWDHYEDGTLDMHMRRLLRFYNQVAILLRQRLIDDDFVFGLIGAGLDTCWPAMKPAIQYYQCYYGGPSGTELVSVPRPIYNAVIHLHESFEDWKGRQVIAT